MTLVLDESLFVANVYVQEYGRRKATFTIVDESLLSAGVIANIKRIICTVRQYDVDGAVLWDKFGSLVIGLGNDLVSVTTEDPTILGLKMTKDNMADCMVELYEE